MDYCHVELEPKDALSLHRLSEFFEMIKHAKESDDPSQEEPSLAAYLSEHERSYFWNPTAADLEEWNKEWFSTPVAVRHTNEALLPQWQLESMLEAFWDGDYELIGVMQEGSRYFVAFNPHGYPFGGTGSFVALVESFGHRVVGVDDGTGYAKHIPRKIFWRPRASREP